MTEQFANNASSTLNGAINNSQTSIIVTNATSFPALGNFRLLLGVNPLTAEIVLVTGVSGTTFTVIRGQEGTVASSWADLTTVTHIVTAGAVEAIRANLRRTKPLDLSLDSVSAAQDGYALTWVNTDGYWAARPGSQWTTASATEIYTTRTVSIDGYGTLASTHGDGTSKLYVNGKVLAGTFSAGEIPLTTQGFGYVSDAFQTFTVPVGVTTLKVKMWGPGGGSGNYAGANGGGPGGFSTGLLSVTPGEVLQLAVGSGGDHPTTINPGPGGLGGWPGGGFGTAGDASGGGGGGFTGIFNTSMTQANALMIAGGGGGATGFSGGNGAGGGGGSVAGGSTSGTSVNGRGATLFAGGADGNGNGTPTTTIAVGSNGVTLPTGTINVASTTGFPTAGIIFVTTSTGRQTVNYTGTTGTTFTGCTGGTGTMSTGGSVAGGVATIAAGSNGVSLPTGTINVASTGGFPTTGTLLVLTSGGNQLVQYTGTNATQFTGCTGGTGTMSTGGTVTLASAGSVFTGGVAYVNRTSFQPTGDDDGGGGSGYFGGGAGRGDGRSGGGGSGFLHATRVTNGTTTTGTNANVNAGATLPPNTTDVNYIAGTGIGGAATGAAGTDGGDGYIVLIWGGITTLDFDSIDFGNTSSLSTLDTNLTISPAINGTVSLLSTGASGGVTLAPGSGTVTLQSSSDFILSSPTNLKLNVNAAQKLKMYTTGAIIVGPDQANNDTSTEAQAGLTGPLINISAATGSITTDTNQATIFNIAGALNLQGNTETRFNTGASLRGYFDSSGLLRIGPSAASTTTLQGITEPDTTATYLWAYNISGSMWGQFISGGSATRAAVTAYNNNSGGVNNNGVAIYGTGPSHAITAYRTNGVVEQSGPSTSALVFSKILGDATARTITGRIWQTGAWSIGDNTQNDTSTEAQAGLTGTLINLSTATGTATSTANQSLLYNIAGSLRLQGNTEVRMEVATTLAGYFDSNRIFRIGPNASTSTSTFGGTNNVPVSTDHAYGFNSGGDFVMRYASGSTTGHSFLDLLNTAGGASTMVMMRMAAGGTASGVTAWQGNGIVEQGGASTSCIVYTATNNVGAGRITTGRMYQSGAWCIGDSVINDTSAEAQAGLTGPLLNLTQITGGSVTSTANQALAYNSAGVNTLQGHIGHALIANTTTVASTSTSKFITNVGRRVATNVKTANYTVTTSDEVIIVGTLASSITITLPSGPTAGDIYTVKDQAGGAVTNNIIISGNGNNIDGAATYTLNTNYQSITVVFANSSWSII